jgi:hypothetical protein
MLLSRWQEPILLEDQSVLTMRTTKDNPLVLVAEVVVAEVVVAAAVVVVDEVASEVAIEVEADASEVATEVEAVVVVDEVASEDEVEAAVPYTRNPVASLILLARK